MRFANDFHSWLRHSWKLLANRLTRDPKIVIHGNSCIILYIIIAALRGQVFSEHGITTASTISVLSNDEKRNIVPYFPLIVRHDIG